MESTRLKSNGNLYHQKQIYNEALAYFRTHADYFIEDVMEIPLNVYQKLLVRAFFMYSFLVWVMCRGTGKTFLGVLCIVTYCLLYPNTKAGIVAPAFRQAKNAIEEKYKGELCQFSPFLSQEEEEYICNTQKAKVKFFNGSWIEAYPIGTDGAKIRGARLHIILIDETAYVPKYIIDNVVKPMMIVKRGYQVGKVQEDYSGNKVLMTSTASYRFNHLYGVFVDYFKKMIEPNNTKYFAMTLPYIIGVRCGLFDEEIVKQQKATMSEMEFEMEYLGRFPRLIDGAWIKYDDLMACSDLEHLEMSGVNEFEYIMSVDVARVEGSDNTVMNIYKLRWFADHIELDLVYIKTLNGASFSEQAKHYRILLKKFPKIIKVFQDTMTIGQGLTDELAKDYYDIDDEKWLPPLIDMNDETAMKNRELTKGVPIIYGIKATAEINHRMGYAIKNFTEKQWLHLYPNRVDELRDITKEEKLVLDETDSTRMEIMNIQTMGESGGWMKFGTKSKRKDRWSAVGLGTYGATILDKERKAKQGTGKAIMRISRRGNRR